MFPPAARGTQDKELQWILIRNELLRPSDAISCTPIFLVDSASCPGFPAKISQPRPP